MLKTVAYKMYNPTKQAKKKKEKKSKEVSGKQVPRL